MESDENLKHAAKFVDKDKAKKGWSTLSKAVKTGDVKNMVSEE